MTMLYFGLILVPILLFPLQILAYEEEANPAELNAVNLATLPSSNCTWPVDSHNQPANDYSAYNQIGNYKYHTGIDLTSSLYNVWNYNTPVKAVTSGTVYKIFRTVDTTTTCQGSSISAITPNHGEGNVVIIQHSNGKFTQYSHLDCIYSGIVPNASVSAGQIIGIMGNSDTERRDTDPNPFTPHVHFEYKDYGMVGSISDDYDGTNPTYWGYTPDPPDGYHFYDPRYIACPQFQTSSMTKTPIQITTDGLNVRTGPSGNYAVVTQVNSGQKFVAFESSNFDGTTWHHIYLPNSGGFSAGWVSGSYVVAVPNDTQLEVFGVGTEGITNGLLIRDSAGGIKLGRMDSTAGYNNVCRDAKIWDGQRFVSLGNQSGWYNFYLPENHYANTCQNNPTGPSTGWSSGNYLNVITGGQTLSVSPVGNPSSGTAPLNGVDLTATVSGTATGTINYTFYCNRSDSGTNITTPYDWKFDNVSDNPKTVVDACNYLSSGTYTAKVIAERGTATPAESRATIIVNTPSETVSSPAILSGTSSGTTGTSYTYTTGGSVSNLGHPVQYQFDWEGDGTELSSWGSATQSKTWSAAGTYYVRTRTRCATDTTVISGWSSSLSVSISASCDTMPNSFTFNDQTGVALNTIVTSNIIAVSGITCAASISITGGTYSVNGGPYTSASGLVNNGDTVTVKVTSSGSYSTITSATLTIGGISDVFSVTTLNALTQQPPTVTTGAAASLGQTSATLKGLVNPNGASTTAYFQWGLTASYGNNTSTQNIGAGTSNVAVDKALTNLACGTIYHYWIVGMNSGGTNHGSDMTFTTASCTEQSDYKLPDTGQTTCWDASGNVITCAGTGQDGAYQPFNPMSFTDNGNGTVTDNNTGLVWQQQDDGNTYNWYRGSGTYEATYNPSSLNVCGLLILGGYADWRLPSRKEMMTIVDYSIPYPGPTINTSYFPNTLSNYWTSNTLADNTGMAERVDFRSGYVYPLYKNNPFYVRCVRGVAQTTSLSDNGDGTVTDKKSGLVWQQAETGLMNWTAALSYCENLSLAGATDWRLPNIKELQFLIDETRYNPAIDTTFFPNAYVSSYWVSTTYASSVGSAWYVDTGDGYIDQFDKNNSGQVRCVHGGETQCKYLPVRKIGLPDSYYTTLQSAYDVAAVTGDIIQVQVLVFTENPDFNRNVSVTLSGGHSCDYTTNVQKSIIDGTMTISNGTVTLENIIIQ